MSKGGRRRWGEGWGPSSLFDDFDSLFDRHFSLPFFGARAPGPRAQGGPEVVDPQASTVREIPIEGPEDGGSAGASHGGGGTAAYQHHAGGSRLGFPRVEELGAAEEEEREEAGSYECGGGEGGGGGGWLPRPALLESSQPDSFQEPDDDEPQAYVAAPRGERRPSAPPRGVQELIDLTLDDEEEEREEEAASAPGTRAGPNGAGRGGGTTRAAARRPGGPARAGTKRRHAGSAVEDPGPGL